LRKFRLTIGGKRYAVSAEREAGTGRLKITLDGRVHLVEVEEENPSRLPSAAPPPRPAVAPAPRPAGGAGGQVIAPLPGLILSVEVEEGQTVEAGEKLLVLEAMKMENIIAAEAGGTVRSLQVRKGDKVEAGQVLMEIA